MSSTNYQFPPSSPLISNSDYAYDDPFAQMSKAVLPAKSHVAALERGRTAYPTPNPSSSIFRSSSPALEVNEKTALAHEVVECPAQVRINKDFNILDPDSSVTRAVLLPDQSQITLGRSSRANDFVFGKVDKYISRVHLLINYNTEKLEIKCVGTNGCFLRIPKSCFVFATNSARKFVIEENTGHPLDVNKELAKQSRSSILVNENHTEFSVNNGETISMPLFANILIEINKNLVLLNPDDCGEDLTDEEDVNERDEDAPINENSKEYTSPYRHSYTPMNSDQSRPPVTPKKFPMQSSTCASAGTPSKPQTLIAPSNSFASLSPLNGEMQSIPREESSELAQEESPHANHSFDFEIFADGKHQLGSKPPVDNTPIIQESSTPPLSLINTNIPSVGQRKPKVTEPKRKKARKLLLTSVVEIDQSWLDGVDGVDEINNVLINHLAFSRLSSTPASFLQTISPLLSGLSLRQIRVILHNVECIGTIYRTGKDAAGKPLEEEYYYMPENDKDEKRQLMISSIRGSSGLRSCRRTHKQYYWKKPAPIKK